MGSARPSSPSRSSLVLAVAILLAAAWGQGQTTWTKYEGNPVLPLGAPGQWDAGNAGIPVVLHDGAAYHMWYSGGRGYQEESIGYATSPDGVAWTKYPGNPVLERGGEGAWDHYFLWPVAAVFDGATYHLWYSAFASQYQQVERTGYATSPDGVTWTKYPGNPILPAGPPGSWDEAGATMQGVLLENGVFRGWYSGARNGGAPLMAGYATSSDGANWDKWPDPVLEPSASGWDLDVFTGPVAFDGGAYHMWYTGMGPAGVQIGHAVSLDGLHWTKQPADEPVLEPGGVGAFDHGGVAMPAVLLVGDTARMWYAGAPNPWQIKPFRMGYATAPLPLPSPPVASFTVTPAEPAVGQPVTFTNATTGTAPITYAWAFGDGATSTDESPAHAYAAAGTYTVSLTATNAVASDTATHDVTVAEATTTPYFIAAAGNAAGAGGSQWATDVEINNPGDAAISYHFLWLPRDTDNSNPTASDSFTLAAGASVRHSNVLESVFGRTGFGALAVAADSADAIVMSRTYNVSAAGTFGQSITGLDVARLIQANERMRVVFMSEDDAFRANLGMLNGTGSAMTVHYALYGADGVLLRERTTELRAWENTQLNRVFQAYAPVSGYVDVWTETAGAAFAAYGSVVDAGTGDPTTVEPEMVDPAEIYVIAAAGNASGAGGSQWATDVEINNPGDAAISYHFLWLPRDTDNSTPTASEAFTLEPGASVRSENVLETVFGGTGFGALAVATDAAGAIVTSRTYNISAAGTFGQSIPGLSGARLIQANQRVRIVFMSEDDAFRANLGMLNGTGSAMTVHYALYGADGVPLRERTTELRAWENTQLNRVFQAYAPVSGYVDVWTETAGAAFAAYGSVVDAGTGDPTTILPE